jgi:hypothetical protein
MVAPSPFLLKVITLFLMLLPGLQGGWFPVSLATSHHGPEHGSLGLHLTSGTLVNQEAVVLLGKGQGRVQGVGCTSAHMDTHGRCVLVAGEGL